MRFRRLSAGLLSAALLLALSACAPDEPAAASSAAPLEPFRAVLLEGGTFHSADEGRDMSLEELLTLHSDDAAQAEFSEFAVADLDGDGAPEVLLREAAGTDEARGFEVLRLRDGAVEGYAFTYRHFAGLKADGTFFVSGGAYDYGHGLLEFAEDTWSIRRLASCETAVAEDGVEQSAYTVCGADASEADFQLALDRQSAKPDAQWLSYAPEHLEAALSGPA